MKAVFYKSDWPELFDEAILYVMHLYEISKEDAVQYYWDEVEAYMRLKMKFEEDTAG